MAYEVEVTDEWLRWYESLGVEEQDGLAASIGLLEAKGPHLPFPYSSGVASSRQTGGMMSTSRERMTSTMSTSGSSRRRA